MFVTLAQSVLMMDTTKPIRKVEDILDFTASLNLQLDRCDNGEGMECSSMDASLERYANCCCEMTQQVKRWGRDVFAGRIPYEQAADDAWFHASVTLNNRAVELHDRAQGMEIPCYDFSGLNKLRAALYGLYPLLDGWVSPRRSVGPSARQATKSAGMETVQKRITELRPLPKGWVPADVRQLSVFRKASKT